jgi:hypothetical protein
VPAPPPLERLFHRTPVVDLDALREALHTPSRTTVFRALRPLGYLTSYSHAGRYYTLRRIPRFDPDGLWWYHDIGFSAQGTLRRTVTQMVEAAPAGYTHEELHDLLHLRVQNTVRLLVAAHALSRRPWQEVFVYLSARLEAADAQWRRRERERMPAPLVLDAARVVDILADVIHHPGADAAAVAARLRRAGQAAPLEQVEAVFSRYGLKKTARSPSRRSRQ